MIKRFATLAVAGLMLLGCASAQFANFRPNTSDKNYQIDVQKSGLPNNQFKLLINKESVIEQSFPMVLTFGKTVEWTATFDSKKVRMVVTFKSGFLLVPNTYTVEVYLDDEKAAQFTFNQ